MALANPLPVDQFAALFGVQDWQLVQAFQQQRSATGGGETAYADRAPSLWRAEGIKTGVMSHADAEGVMARINSRAGGLKTILLYNKRLPFPADDPDGAIIGGIVPKLNVITDRLHVSFSGFPPSYRLKFGTFFGLIFDTSRYYLGQVCEDRIANPITGAVASVEIWPPLPASVVSGTDISVRKPPAKFRIVPGSAYPSVVSGLNSEITFSAEQTYSR